MERNEQLALLQEAAEQAGCRSCRNERMSEHTTFAVGGPVDLMLTVPNLDALRLVLSTLRRLELPYHVMGKGSNLLVSDEGIRGVMLVLSDEFAKLEVTGNRITCGAAMSLTGLSKAAADHSLTGMEGAWGIPGSVGGGLFMNAGAYDFEMKNVIVSADFLQEDGTLVTLQKEEMDLSYRHSAFQRKKGIITSVTVELQPSDEQAIREKVKDFMTRRSEKQPLNYPSAGSTFKRPEGHFAGKLIEDCGLKGKRVGGAAVSEKHAGFVINQDHATCQDILDLIHLIQETVKTETGVDLECEIRYLS